MTDAAAGPVDKSVQVKLVLLGMSFLYGCPPIRSSCLKPPHLLLTAPPTRRGGRWQVVRRSSIRESLPHCHNMPGHAFLSSSLGIQRISTEQRTHYRGCVFDPEVSSRGSCAPL